RVEARRNAVGDQAPEEVGRADQDAAHDPPQSMSLGGGPTSGLWRWGAPKWPPIPPPRSALYLLGGLVADLEPVAIAVRPRQQGRPAAEPPEVPGLVTLAVIGPGDGDHLRRIPGDEHVAAAAGRRVLHRDLGQLFLFHGSCSALGSARRVVRQAIGVT